MNHPSSIDDSNQRGRASWACLCAISWLACSDFASEHDTMAMALPLDPSTLVTSAWACTSNALVDDPLVYAEAASLVLSIQVIDIFARATPPNLTVRACLITDPPCEQPISADLYPDADGVVDVPLPVGVSGFLEARADGVAPALIVLPRPLSVELAALVSSRPVVLVPNGASASADISLRARAEPDTATLFVTAFDCAGRGASGVRLEIDTPALPFAIIDGLPILNERTTTSYATAGFINVPPGVAVVSGYRDDTGEMVARDAIPVRSGWDILVNMLPERGFE